MKKLAILSCFLLSALAWCTINIPIKSTPAIKAHALTKSKVEGTVKEVGNKEGRLDSENMTRKLDSRATENIDIIALDTAKLSASENTQPQGTPNTEQTAKPLSVRLEISNIYQNPELPNGCEATSLAMVLAYEGFSVSKTDIVNKNLPKAKFYYVGKERKLASSDPNDFFIGDPASEKSAYYCYAKPIAQAGNAYLQSVENQELIAKDLTGADEQELISQLAAGNPIITWATINMHNAAFYSDKPLIINKQGDVHIPFANLHCVVLSGYDEEFFYYSDPLSGNKKCKRAAFINVYNQIGSRAVAIE